VQGNPLAHQLSNHISKRGVFEALEQDALVCHAVSGQLESEAQVLFPARNILGDREVVYFQAQAHGPPCVLALHRDYSLNPLSR
jgi:hypothetical protein